MIFNLRHVIISLLFLCLSSGMTGANHPIGTNDWLILQSSPFAIYYFEPNRVVAEKVASLLQLAYADLAAQMKLKLTSPVSVFLAPSQNIFDDLTSNSVPHWGEGVADPVRSLIILKSPAKTAQNSRLAKLVRHELTHVLIGQSVPRRLMLPKWFNEGLAIYVAADEQFAAGKAISKALISNSIIPLDEIDEVLKFQHAKATLAYEESYSFTLYISDKYGFDAIVQLIHNLDGNDSFEQAFQAHFGVELFEDELAWYEYLNKKYRWKFLLDFELYLWIFILLLFIGAFATIRLRNRSTLTRWDNEDRLSGYDDHTV